MILTKEFFNDHYRVKILEKLEGELKEGMDVPKLTEYVDEVFSSAIWDHTMTYNGYTFYCVGNTEQIDNQIIEYSKRHRGDTIDSILKNEDEE